MESRPLARCQFPFNLFGFRSWLITAIATIVSLVLIGALAYFAPAQFYIGIASLVLLAWALHLRFQAINSSCCAAAQ